MKSLKKNSEWIKRSLIIVLAAIIMITSIVLFSLSIEAYEGGFDADMDYVVMMICGVSLLIYGIYSIYALKKNKSVQIAYYSSFGAISVLLAFYPLGVFFKAISKGKPYLENQEYLYMGILGIVLCLYLTFSYISDHKEK